MIDSHPRRGAHQTAPQLVPGMGTAGSKPPQAILRLSSHHLQGQRDALLYLPDKLEDILANEQYQSQHCCNHRYSAFRESDDGSGNIIEEKVTASNTWLYVTFHHLTAEEMASEPGFVDDQTVRMEALLAEENNPLWTAVLYGIAAADDQIVSVALSQVGNEEQGLPHSGEDLALFLFIPLHPVEI